LPNRRFLGCGCGARGAPYRLLEKPHPYESSLLETLERASPIARADPLFTSDQTSADELSELRELGLEATLDAFGDHADGIVAVQALEVRAGDLQIADAGIGVQLLID
jgi:hypothetical protein